MSSENKIKVIQPSGLLDRTQASGFNEEVNKCIEQNPKIVLINFNDVIFMDSSGLGAVVLAIKNVQSNNKEIYVCSLNNQLKMLFELSGLNKVIEIFEDRESFEKKKGVIQEDKGAIDREKLEKK